MSGRLLLIILCFIPLSYDICFGENRIILEGEHKFATGDNLKWALPSYDDSGWREIKIPGSWQSQGVESEDGMGWYRIRFDAKSLEGQSNIGVFLGKIGDADEVFLNGVKIGGEGVIDRNFVEATHKQRLYRIPEKLMLYNIENLLAVRVLNTYMIGGISEDKIIIGNYNELLAEKRLYEKKRSDINTAFLTFYTVFFIFCVLMYLAGVRDSSYLTFTFVAFIYLICYLLSMDVFYDLRSSLIQRIIFVFTSLLPASFIWFLKETFRERFNILDKFIVAIILFLAFALILPVNIRIYRLIVFVWSLFTVVVIFMSVYYSMKAVLNRRTEAYIHFTGVIFLSLGTLYWMAERFFIIRPYYIYGFSPADFTMPVAILCFIYAVDRRFAETMKSLKFFTDKMLISLEEERKRISRDIHDGIGQSLMSIKLKLQMFESKIPERETGSRKDLKDIIGNVSDSIQELREISMNIRPSFLENMGLTEILHWYVEQLRSQTGLNVKTNILDLKVKLTNGVKEAIYRICQEAISNVIKHSEADTVIISLDKSGGYLLFSVEDNGKGFEEVEIRGKTGLGLYTMRERAELIGGLFEIESKKKRGTKLTVRIPV